MWDISRPSSPSRGVDPKPYRQRTPLRLTETYESQGVPSHQPMHRTHRRRVVWLAVFLGLIAIGTLGAYFLQRTLMRASEQAVTATLSAVASVRDGNIEMSQQQLAEAERSFRRGALWLRPFSWLPRAGLRVPLIAHGITAEALFRAGRDGVHSAQTLLTLLPVLLPEHKDAPNSTFNMIEALARSGEAATRAHVSLVDAQNAFERVRLDTLPEAHRERVAQVREAIPIATALLGGYVSHQELFAELLGANGPRTYLFLFQNNHELRATGGFIGSYALLDIRQGSIRRFFVDGIFNPDGQLKENIVPPAPIQKISAGWSLHDSNWFPDFPTSAEKAIFFYEKTGGPTVDGIITLTPEVLGRILALTGPIALPEYGVTIDAVNFIPIIQEEVEVNYDRNENEPKRILGDLTEALLKRFLSFDNPHETWRLGSTLAELLDEKHVLLYSRHPAIETLIRRAGWSGEVLETPYDYLSVVHSNINGYKTDGVIRETIMHETSIDPDGWIIDTVSITRQHTGGNTPYEWWNKVNADYLRVYVPNGSKLLSAEGMTREFPEPPLDYDALGFRRDEAIEREERSMTIDENSGTRISEDAGKTVFGNWVYVSPGESVTVRYVYELPFRIVFDPADDVPVHSFSTLYQKQSGAKDVRLKARLSYPERWQLVWQTNENLVPYERNFEHEQPLQQDFYWGFVFQKSTPSE